MKEDEKKTESNLWVGVVKRVLIAIWLFWIVYCVENWFDGLPFIISCTIVFCASDIKY